jgi:hypothetical protein
MSRYGDVSHNNLIQPKQRPAYGMLAMKYSTTHIYMANFHYLRIRGQKCKWKIT